MLSALRWLWSNLLTLITSFVLAVAVWILAVTAADPNEERIFPFPVPIEFIGQNPGLLLVGDYPKTVTVTLSAPRSVWGKLTANQQAVNALIDLSGLEQGTSTLPIQVQVNIKPVRIISTYPLNISLNLEKLGTKTLPIQLVTRGEPATGYQVGSPSLSSEKATISGPQSKVELVETIRALLLLNRTQIDIDSEIPLEPIDSNENVIAGVSISPEIVTVTASVTQLGGYRDMVVKVPLIGQVAPGYRLTNISVSPPAVTVFSSDPQRVNDLPGFIETVPLDISNAKDNLDIRLGLNLPDGIIAVGEQTVLAQVGIESIESSLTLSRMKIGSIGLRTGMVARISPETVDIILSGPLPVLDKLKASDINVVIDLRNMAAGTYQVHPSPMSLPDEVIIQSILPETVEVTILSAADAKKTPTP